MHGVYSIQIDIPALLLHQINDARGGISMFEWPSDHEFKSIHYKAMVYTRLRIVFDGIDTKVDSYGTMTMSINDHVTVTERFEALFGGDPQMVLALFYYMATWSWIPKRLRKANIISVFPDSLFIDLIKASYCKATLREIPKHVRVSRAFKTEVNRLKLKHGDIN